jgi:hypothetical protein
MQKEQAQKLSEQESKVQKLQKRKWTQHAIWIHCKEHLKGA